MDDIGIVIVTHNSATEIGECLEAALPSGARVLVVDNASADSTVAGLVNSDRKPRRPSSV